MADPHNKGADTLEDVSSAKKIKTEPETTDSHNEGTDTLKEEVEGSPAKKIKTEPETTDPHNEGTDTLKEEEAEGSLAKKIKIEPETKTSGSGTQLSDVIVQGATETKVAQSDSSSEESVALEVEFLTSGSDLEWCSEDEAREYCDGSDDVNWWELTGVCGETVKDGCQLRALFDIGVLHIGGYTILRPQRPRKGSYHRSEFADGFGVVGYGNGRVVASNFVSGIANGLTKQVWLPSSSVWKDNNYPPSKIVEKSPLGNVGRPYIYIGNYHKGLAFDPSATVILKDGTVRCGPWKRGVPLGDWWKHQTHPQVGPEEFATILAFNKDDSSDGKESDDRNRTRIPCFHRGEDSESDDDE